MKRMLLCALATVAITQGAAAQDPVVTALTSTASGTFIDPPKACADQLKGGDFRVSSGKSYYKTAMSQSDPTNRVRILKNAQTNLTDAIGAGSGQEKLATTWYWMGRTDAALGDVPGADSTWTKALTLAPACKADIDSNRQQLWTRLVNLAADRQKANDTPGSLAMYRAANQIYRDSPQGYLSMGAVFAQAQQNDSAEHYFELAAKANYVTTDSVAVSLHNQAVYNTGVMQLGAKEWTAAVATFRTYVAQNPTDTDAKKGLAQAFIGAGMEDSARVVLAQLGMLPAADPVDSLFNAGVAQYQAGDYQAAAASFGKVVEMEPFLREGLLNLANSQSKLKDGKGLMVTSRKLVALEPLNESYVGLLAAGYRQTNATADLNKLGTEVAGWPISVVVSKFTPTADGATLSGTATGRDPKDPAGKSIKPAPVTLAFELFDATGTTVWTGDVTVPALPMGQTSPIELSGAGKGVVSYRYHRK